MSKLPDTIYIVDPYDEDGDLVANTEDVCWCQDAVGDINIAYVSRVSVRDALEELRSDVLRLPTADYSDGEGAELIDQDSVLELIDGTVTALGLGAKEKSDERNTATEMR